MADVYYFSGLSKWAKVYEPSPDYDKTKSSYKIELHFDEASLDLFKDSGLQLKLKTDEETGTTYTTFRRPTSKLIKGDIVEYGPPEIIGVEGDSRIGNGSEVTVKVTVYNGARGKGHQLEAVKVDRLVPYDGNKVYGAVDVPF